ncbi:MAG TPA: FMN-binding negative transcriptional regulator [Acidocella sp.]|jgi:transcriptional regulator|uniref:FMN-binding negative transcriptional regulator n=1 Tax=Acidocella sp. TaxID=50710 RepID=UPI002C45F0A9|nr:FMN-binding negative transcriptional regulator [Acidocella sp.]HVE23738.1 FMN-binding negative transcriptional regulator [Acidocella sp.]
MYIPPAFAENDPAELHAIMRTASLPILVSPTAEGLIATHLPLSFQAPDRIVGHFARANPHWRNFTPDADSLAIFTAMDGYVSPSWYPTKAETGKVVPTWNYTAVHATGRLEIIEDPEALREIVTSLTDRFEAGREKPWAVSDAPPDYVAAMLKGIVGVVLHVTKLEGKSKLSQNKSRADQEGVAAGAATENPALAEAMRKVLGRK